jgi:hypothetical protein
MCYLLIQEINKLVFQIVLENVYMIIFSHKILSIVINWSLLKTQPEFRIFYTFLTKLTTVESPGGRFCPQGWAGAGS